jgi:hypothetical protein
MIERPINYDLGTGFKSSHAWLLLLVVTYLWSCEIADFPIFQDAFISRHLFCTEDYERKWQSGK